MREPSPYTVKEAEADFGRGITVDESIMDAAEELEMFKDMLDFPNIDLKGGPYGS